MMSGSRYLRASEITRNGVAFAGTFGAAYAMVVIVGVLAVLAFARLATDHVRVETNTITKAPKVTDAAGARKVLGAPQGEIPGEQINASLKGATCALYQYAAGVAFVCS